MPVMRTAMHNDAPPCCFSKMGIIWPMVDEARININLENNAEGAVRGQTYSFVVFSFRLEAGLPFSFLD